MDKPLTPYEKGRAEAWLSSATRNPYDRNSEAEREWFMGWQDAKNQYIANLEAALVPFARMSDSYDDEPASHVIASKRGTILSVYDLRLAKAAGAR